MKQISHLFLFYYPLVMGLIWITGGLLFFIRREKKIDIDIPDDELPFVSVLIPAHNEEYTIAETIQHCSTLNYPGYEIIVINDGSTDRTIDILEQLLKQYPSLRVVHLNKNKGKANALIQGVLVSRGDYVATIDSDAILDKDALRYMISHFIIPNNGERVGAVTGNPRTRNRASLLSKIQLLEYTSIIGLIKRTQRLFGKVMTVSGVCAVFRKKALFDVGMWDTDLITDDIGITWKLQRRFWDIRYEPKALCWMWVPDTFKGIWKQRLRWTQGGIEVMLRHSDIFLDWRQRRLFPVFIEQVLSFTWAHLWFVSSIVAVYNFFFKQGLISPILLISNYLAIISVLQFTIAVLIERQYEKGLFKYLFWSIWYPLVYWQISALLVVVAFPKALKILRKSNKQFATWKSPIREVES
ncbi:poly-beta-1,6-N-acetyl-D-glucosamine synthase [Peribacillus alkalitolerans]|uniref:poly-beta-1,6-N-acetyl-D-glucosamine synthase n=1 Tax=Peribacillus alkalitolerans TaxID=1550385 RepID=UPI001F075183|nr:poly-beta-1,6-N-acetyl-D-glucosamine synthase [Peribacillus alkalitolerans]